ncbi:MAG: 3-isopropylmalate dehydratase small subunit [Treponemataceae bacterium]
MSDSSTIRTIRSRALPLRGDDIDTDRIIPARFLRAVTFDGLGEYVFCDVRVNANGQMNEHPFNDPRYAGAGILLVGRNFGCGSSREHAPQALARWGVKAIIGESFADIFAGNCAAIGLVVVSADADMLKTLWIAAETTPPGGRSPEIEIDLETMTAKLEALLIHVEMPESRRRNFLAGTWDTTATLLANKARIEEVAARLPYCDGFIRPRV